MRQPIVLVHAPLVGPSSWSWVADELASRDIEVVVPDLHRTVVGQLPDDFADALGTVLREHDSAVVVGHSGAGPLLPVAAARAEATVARYVFVDAAVPPSGSPVPVSAAFRSHLDAMVGADGLLPPWHSWWGADGMSSLVHDDERRARVSADMPRLPLAYFDAEVVAPEGWEHVAGGFVLLSETYRPHAVTARAHGWPTIEVSGTHLELVNDPAAVASAIVRMLASPR